MLVFQGLVATYFNESNMIYALVFFVWSFDKIFEDIFEVWNKHILYKVFILFNIVVFKIDFIIVHKCLVSEV